MGRARTLLLLCLCHTCCAVLEITVLPSQVGIVQTDARLSCMFKVEKHRVDLQFLAVFWHFGNKEITRYDSKMQESASRFTIDEQAVKQGDASLTIRNVTVSDQGNYKCTVVYSPDNQEKQTQLNVLAVPVVRIQKKAVQRGVTNLLQCSISNFFPKDMKVIWLKNGEILRRLLSQDDMMNADKTFTRSSAVNITFLEEEGNPNITCQVEHEYFQDPIKDIYTVQYGAAPTVKIKSSRIPDGNDQIYMCEATNYFPAEMAMHWLLDGKRIDSPRQSNNEYFNKEICYRIQLDGNNPPSQISCEVQHETLYSPIRMTEEVKVEQDCKRSCHSGLIGVLLGLLIALAPALWYFMKRASQRFQVGHIHRIQTADDKVTLYCMASNCPKDVEVTWTIQENDGEKIIISAMKKKTDEEAGLIAKGYTVETDRSRSNNLHHAISTLSFTPTVSKHKQMEVFCTFHYDRRSQKKHLKCSFMFKKPEVSGPVQLTLGDNGDVLCSVSLQNFYPKDIKIEWSHGVGHFQDVETIPEPITKNNDFTFKVKSVCRIPGHLFKDQGYRVRATWSHNAESGQQEASIADSAWRPVMGEIEKPALQDGKEAELLCRVSGYFPDALDVKWLRRDAESPEFYIVSASDKYRIPVMEATQQKDKTLSYTACLVLSASAAADYGAEFMCRVRHPSLETPLERRTGELRVTGIRAVNMTLVDKEKLRADVLHSSSKDIKITWSRHEGNKNYEEYKDPARITTSNRDGGSTTWSELVLKEVTKNIKYYKVVVEDKASNSVVEKVVLRENGEWYLLNEKERPTPLPEMAGQQQQGVRAENKQLAADPSAGIRAVNVMLVNKQRVRAEVLHSSDQIKITWSLKGRTNKECKDTDTSTAIADLGYTTRSEIPAKSHKDKKKYKVVVKDKASNSVVEKILLQQKGEWYLLDEKEKTPLPQITDQQPEVVRAENKQPAADPSAVELNLPEKEEKNTLQPQVTDQQQPGVSAENKQPAADPSPETRSREEKPED